MKTLDIYVAVFDENSVYWSNAREYNLFFLRAIQNLCNLMLREKGSLTLERVLSELGIPKTKASQNIGWLYDENDCIDFGIQYNLNDDDPAFLLIFNVNGYIT